MAKGKKKISLAELCDEALDQFNYAKQWDALNHPELVAEYIHQAKGIIQIVEVSDCGSIGGFSRGMNPHKSHTIRERIDFLHNKYVKQD